MSLALPVQLQIVCASQPGVTWLRWESDVTGVRTSRMAPLPAADMAPALRALEAIQDPAYPRAWTADQRRRFAFSPDEQERLAALGLWEAGRVHPAAPRRLGRLLFRALVADPAGAQALGTARDHAAALGRPLAIELCLPANSPELAALPWELLWDDGPLPLLMSPSGVTLARRIDLPRAMPPSRRRSGPVQILAVSPRAGISPELRQVERAARLAAWRPLIESGRAVMEEIDPASRATLLRSVIGASPPDIVHFYGHGRYQNGEGALLLDDKRGGSWTSAAALAAALADVGVVILHACQGAAISAAESGDAPALAGVAAALCAAGVPATLGMQFSIRAEAAARLAAVLYTALAEGRSLEAALAAARRDLFIGEPDGVSWFGPALYLRERAGAWLYLRGAAPPSLAAAPAPAPAVAAGARQVVLARGGSVRNAHLYGGPGSRQRIVAEDGGAVSDVSIHDGPPAP